MNVWHFPTDRKVRAAKIARELEVLDADYVLLQEVPYTDNGESEFLNDIVEYTGYQVAAGHGMLPITNHGPRYLSGLAILSKAPVLESGISYAPTSTQGTYQSNYAVLNENGKAVILFNIHGFWGGNMAHKREAQIKEINRHATWLEKTYSDMKPIVLLAGDFNSEPESSVIRYLKGLQSIGSDGAYWVDSWDYAGQGEGFTSTPKLRYFSDTANSVGIANPSATPERRIDYIFSKGWNYGRAGTPLKTTLCFTEECSNGYTVSDHYGVSAEIQFS